MPGSDQPIQTTGAATAAEYSRSLLAGESSARLLGLLCGADAG